ncbi:MAG: D-TA family PLP-dependent enzyme [Bacteroidota bacterium]
MREPTTPWYELNDPSLLDTPCLMVHPETVKANIQKMCEIAGKKERLIPHVKTHKMEAVARMHLAEGLASFKCATVAEAEMLAQAGAESILLAHQLVGPKLARYMKLVAAYPDTSFSTIVDDMGILKQIIQGVTEFGGRLGLWIDLDNGMHRSGIMPGREAQELIEAILSVTSEKVVFEGLHVYDGHLRDQAFNERKDKSDMAFEAVESFIQELAEKGITIPKVVAGGSPTFPVHSLRENIFVSPGTYVFWDYGYEKMLPELPFEWAAIIATRIISKPGENRLTLDLGHKAIAAENPLEKRVYFPALPKAVFVGQSEEHLVIHTEEEGQYQVGDVLYGVPHHICPTVALHQQAYVIKSYQIIDHWKVSARDRMLTI